MVNHMSNQPIDALVDPEYRKQVQGLKDVTAALKGEPSSPMIFFTNAESVLNRKVRELPPIRTQIKVRADGTEIDGKVIGHSEKDGKPIIDYLGPCKLSSGQLSKPTTRWAWVDQLI
jgi:hypothetical protein